MLLGDVHNGDCGSRQSLPCRPAPILFSWPPLPLSWLPLQSALSINVCGSLLYHRLETTVPTDRTSKSNDLALPDNNNNRFQRRNSRVLQSPHCAANHLQHVRSSGPGAIVCKSRATHRAFFTCSMLYATWYEGTVQLLSLTELKSHLFELYFIS